MGKPLTRKQFVKFLRDSGACSPAMSWIRRNKGGPYKLLMKCDQPDWIGWFAEVVSWNMNGKIRQLSDVPYRTAFSTVMTNAEKNKMWDRHYYCTSDEQETLRSLIKQNELAELVGEEAQMQWDKAWIMDHWPRIQANILKELER